MKTQILVLFSLLLITVYAIDLESIFYGDLVGIAYLEGKENFVRRAEQGKSLDRYYKVIFKKFEETKELDGLVKDSMDSFNQIKAFQTSLTEMIKQLNEGNTLLYFGLKRFWKAYEEYNPAAYSGSYEMEYISKWIGSRVSYINNDNGDQDMLNNVKTSLEKAKANLDFISKSVDVNAKLIHKYSSDSDWNPEELLKAMINLNYNLSGLIYNQETEEIYEFGVTFPEDTQEAYESMKGVYQHSFPKTNYAKQLTSAFKKIASGHLTFVK